MYWGFYDLMAYSVTFNDCNATVTVVKGFRINP